MILSIESSCDDSSLALTRIDDAKLLWHKKISQESTHSTYGGVVPEIASRMHAQDLPRLLKSAKESFDFSKIKAIGVTTEPGLSVTLIEGLMMAKTLSLELALPLIGVNHLKGHVYSLFIDKLEMIFPLGILLVSGGHTQILQADSADSMRLVASTMDDSFGESFDKVAKMLELGYPGGVFVESLAKEYEGELYPLPIPLKNHPQIAFSFSGLKNAVRLTLERESKPAKLAKSFQTTACLHLLAQVERYFKRHNAPKHFAIVGGASANLFLRQEMQKLCEKYKKELLLAPLEYCSDNAAMIGRCAREKYLRGEFSDVMGLQCSPRSSAGEFAL